MIPLLPLNPPPTGRSTGEILPQSIRLALAYLHFWSLSSIFCANHADLCVHFADVVADLSRLAADVVADLSRLAGYTECQYSLNTLVCTCSDMCSPLTKS